MRRGATRKRCVNFSRPYKEGQGDLSQTVGRGSDFAVITCCKRLPPARLARASGSRFTGDFSLTRPQLPMILQALPHSQTSRSLTTQSRQQSHPPLNHSSGKVYHAIHDSAANPPEIRTAGGQDWGPAGEGRKDPRSDARFRRLGARIGRKQLGQAFCGFYRVG